MDQVTDALRLLQEERERDAVGLGVKRYHEDVAQGRADTTVGQRLKREAFTHLRAALADQLKKLRGRQADIRDFLMKLDMDTLVFATAHALVNEMAVDGRGRWIQDVAIELAGTLESTLDYAELAKVDPEEHKRTVRRARRASSAWKRHIILEKAKKRAEMKSKPRTDAELARLGLWLIKAACQLTGFAEVTAEFIGTNKRQGVLRATQEMQAKLKAEDAKLEALHPRMFPMICEPIDWRAPTGGGFLTKALQQTAIRRLGADTPMDYQFALKADQPVVDGVKVISKVYSAMNALQHTAWAVNEEVLNVLRTAWDSGLDIAELPGKTLRPLLAKVDPADAEAFAARQAAARKIHQANDAEREKRQKVAGDLDTAERMRQAARFYFVHTMDFRGRLYACSDYMNPQGGDTSKALLRFADGVALGVHGARWLAIHGANCFGVDKVSFNDRLAWVRDNEQNIVNAAKDPLGATWWGDKKVDSPWRFLAFCFEWARLVEWRNAGNADADFVSYLPVSVDGTCNGLQHLTMLMRDRKGAEAVNLLPSTDSDTPADAYRKVAEAAKNAHPKLKDLLDDKLWRAIAKQPTMTLVYGAGLYTNREQVVETLREHGVDMDEDLWELAGEVAPVLRDAIEVVAERAAVAMDWLRKVAQAFADNGYYLSWYAPAGLEVVHRPMKLVGELVDIRVDGVRRRFTVQTIGKELDKRRMVSGIVANFVHSLDAAHLMQTVEYALERGIRSFAMVHDSYGTHAGNMQALNEELREAFAEQYSNDLLAWWVEHAMFVRVPVGEAPSIPELPEIGDLDPEEVVRSKYFFA